MKKLNVILVSGGRTSVFLSKYWMEKHSLRPVSVYLNKGKPSFTKYVDEKGIESIFLFMNTSKERKETLQFMNDAELFFGIKAVWLEAVVKSQKGTPTGFRITKSSQAKLDGSVFESMLRKYPLPNNRASNCTRELKQRPKEQFLKEFFPFHEIVTVVGIRADEAHRKSINAFRDKVIYPLCDEFPVTSEIIRNWWSRQSFDLKLKDYEGNCDLCFKKSLKKRLTIIKENPEKAQWWLEMEQKYSSEEIPRFDLRTNKSIQELVEMASKPFTKAEDLFELSQQQKDLFDFETDCFCKSS